ncbi:RseC/MucC-like positive regulator of sigma(E) [Bacteroides zoogleoformans]|uniref:RseC/MucC family positive regulator of sigma(E) n=1 Tax=Bacteroides zoogleoformans TaxID=28119 RepID=A0ABN5IM71_9BACE|nr:SoxR reducing system RseC family protein [Bacteroides zoogleoformans]AVM53861.1 RseC/MucC family positive regulator of sigma(E) [Bacteroides zoogleoformans]TWJ13709.1 RseC/MucC-like positive regulator of sigma(E) [Bacteroides zoogleoformans]
MANTIIRHQGIVENISDSHLQVRIVQASVCASCSVKGQCSSADTKEKLIDVFDMNAARYCPGDQVWVIGQLSMGAMAVLLAFVLPFLVLIISLFVLMAVWNDELFAAIGSLGLLIPYYYILWLNKSRMGKKFSFSILPMN